VTSKKRSSLVFLQTLGANFSKSNKRWAPFLPRFSGILPSCSDFQGFCPTLQGFFPDFQQIKTFGGALWPPAPPPPTPLPIGKSGPAKPTLLIGWHRFTLFAVKA